MKAEQKGFSLPSLTKLIIFLDTLGNRCLLSKFVGLQKRFEIALQFGIMVVSRILRE